MNKNQNKIFSLLHSLADDDYVIRPAKQKQLDIFNQNASERCVDQCVIDQLNDLYIVANEFYYEIIIQFHSCDDILIFEWWDYQELWLGQRDFYTLRWSNGKFCLDDASNISFSDEYEFETLIQLIEGCIKYIDEVDYFDKKTGK
jgi:hypothetical protein